MHKIVFFLLHLLLKQIGTKQDIITKQKEDQCYKQDIIAKGTWRKQKRIQHPNIRTIKESNKPKRNQGCTPKQAPNQTPST